MDGSWQDLREQLRLRDRVSLVLQEYSETYINEYAKARNKTRSWKRKETSLRALKKHLGRLELEMIAPVHLHQYVKKRKREGVSDATINRDLTVIKHLLTYASECGLIRQNHVERFKNLREERKERQRFIQEQVETVINAVREDCRAVFLFILETGCRREEDSEGFGRRGKPP
jgi:site-specific recombinase XerD